MSENDSDNKNERLDDWVRVEFDRIYKRAIAGDEYTSNVVSIEKQFEIRTRRIAELSDEDLLEIYGIPGWEKRLEADFARVEIDRTKVMLEGFYKQAKERKAFEKERLDFDRQTSKDTNLQNSKYLLIGYGVAIFTVLTAIIASTTKPELLEPLQMCLWILAIGVSFALLGNFVGLISSLFSQFFREMKFQRNTANEADKDISNVKIFIFFVLGIPVSVIAFIFDFVSVAALPGALILFLVHDNGGMAAFQALQDMVGF